MSSLKRMHDHCFSLQDKLTRKNRYNTTYSSWKFENPPEIHNREAEITADWESLGTLSVNKKVPPLSLLFLMHFLIISTGNLGGRPCT